MKICFILPGYPRRPIGGYKVVFEYANELVDHGYDVSILFQNNEALDGYPFPEFVKLQFIRLFTKIEPRWFNLDKRIKKLSFRNKNCTSEIKETDIAIATALSTVEFTKNMFSNSKLCYLIQGFENWNGVSNEEVYRTYNMGFKKIVVSKSLQKIVEAHSLTPSTYVPNPLDINVYNVKIPIDKRNPYLIGMLYHENPMKGSRYALAAVKRVKRIFPKIHLIMFGTAKIPENLPNWIEYHQNASQSETIEIYNEISIFVNATIFEGFGLTGLEAMACGSALVSTDYPAVHEYATEENAMLSPVKNVDSLSKNIEILIKNSKKRIKIAKNGQKMAQNYSIDKAYARFEKAILS
ncbi:glycosyltransferase family 4 protein [Lactobacillus amylovorus]|uniref:glycosyltransferase family 4 protein n=1 Tax=Lactobacillus amylovorus TaxID=1604 RepID=UPI001F57D6C8|nr:glycosyltransferase family 4 protein [Lactobacillus amylovorus]UNL46184.1 glycosyltransferase family 4 protein [Lactobacillus amylovorus]